MEEKYREEPETDNQVIPRNAQYVATRGGKTHKQDLAEPREKHRSRHYAEMKTVEGSLDVKKEELRNQAIQKDRIFNQNVKNFKTRIDRFRAKLDNEIRDKTEEYNAVKKKFEDDRDDLNQKFSQELQDSCNVVETEWLPPQENRIIAWKEDFDHFVNVTVPETIENQSGRVTRHLIKSQEMFEIDNTKLLKRERKIVTRFGEHVANVKQNMYEQEKKRRSCFLILDEDIYEQERDADRSEESSQTKLLSRVKEVQDMQGGLAGIRQETDSDILLTIEAAMSRLQKTVLENFGSSN